MHESHPLEVVTLFVSFNEKRSAHVSKTLRILRIKYSADFRRSRLVRLILGFFNKYPPKIILQNYPSF